jgi:hypothetical protein
MYLIYVSSLLLCFFRSFYFSFLFNAFIFPHFLLTFFLSFLFYILFCFPFYFCLVHSVELLPCRESQQKIVQIILVRNRTLETSALSLDSAVTGFSEYTVEQQMAVVLIISSPVTGLPSTGKSITSLTCSTFK